MFSKQLDTSENVLTFPLQQIFCGEFFDNKLQLQIICGLFSFHPLKL